MPHSDDTLIYVARLSSNEMQMLFVQDEAFPTSDLKSILFSAVADVCMDRLVRAEGCLQVAQQLYSSNDEETLRTAAGRAYYCIHHCLRVMALWQNKWDPDGHEESIDQFKILLKNNKFVHQSGLDSDTWGKVMQARNNRHVADYSPYDRQRAPQGIVRITGDDWTIAAQFNRDLAAEILSATYKVIGL